MIINLGEAHSLVSNWVAEIRDVNVQHDRLRFRRNLERIAEVAAYEISKKLAHKIVDVQTPLGIAPTKVIADQPVLATILRAGLAMHHGLLNYFDKADNAFISAYRKHNADGSFEIALDYLSCPSLENRVVIISDPMLATGSSLVKTVEFLKAVGHPSEMHIVCAIACQVGIDFLLQHEPNLTVWCGTIDPVLNEKGYIIPGLGDAGDLAFGTKVQN